MTASKLTFYAVTYFIVFILWVIHVKPKFMFNIFFTKLKLQIKKHFKCTKKIKYMLGCELCLCDLEIKYIECRVSAIIHWPPFPYFNNSAIALSFLDTFISELPIIKDNEYRNLTSLYLFDNEYLTCSEIISFADDNENVSIFSDKDCGSVTTSVSITYNFYITDENESSESNTVTENGE